MTIDADLVRQSLLDKATTRPRFKLPLPTEQAERLLAAAMDAQVIRWGGTPVSDDDQRKAIAEAADFLTNPGRRWGLIVMGTVGNGKTSFLRAITTLIAELHLSDGYGGLLSVRWRTAKDICQLARTDTDAFVALCRTPMLAIDDLGEEATEVMDYGTVVTPLIDLLSLRYDRQLFTLVTTNISNKQIRENYGDRVADRFNEMMRVIIFRKKSYRR